MPAGGTAFKAAPVSECSGLVSSIPPDAFLQLFYWCWSGQALDGLVPKDGDAILVRCTVQHAIFRAKNCEACGRRLPVGDDRHRSAKLHFKTFGACEFDEATFRQLLSFTIKIRFALHNHPKFVISELSQHRQRQRTQYL